MRQGSLCALCGAHAKRMWRQGWRASDDGKVFCLHMRGSDTPTTGYVTCKRSGQERNAGRPRRASLSYFVGAHVSPPIGVWDALYGPGPVYFLLVSCTCAVHVFGVVLSSF